MYVGLVEISFIDESASSVDMSPIDPDWPRRYSDRFGANRDRGADGALEKARGHPRKTKTISTT